MGGHGPVEAKAGFEDAASGGEGCRPLLEDLPPRPRMNPADRARQFMPFAALRGYRDLIRACERVPEPRHELTEEEALGLSRRVAALERGDMVRVVRYDGDAYAEVTGMVSCVDACSRVLTVVKTRIPFDDIRAIEVVAPAARG